MKRNPVLDPGLERELELLALRGGFRSSEDQAGNRFHWFRLGSPGDLPAAARLLAARGARLCTVTAYDPRREHDHPRHEVAYHFDCGGVLVTVTAALDEGEPRVPSIMTEFTNADWNERELAELYGIQVTDRPTPARLFLDESLERGAMDRVIPVSVLMNGASSSTLWERIMGERQDESGSLVVHEEERG